MTLSLLCAAFALFGPADDGSKPARYARPELLIEASELAKPEVAKGLRILDGRARSRYVAGHVPGAVWVDPEAWAKLFVAGQDKDVWAKEIGRLGITPETPVVVYDDSISGAARVWWILSYWGVKDARLLNGGWAAWQEAKAPVSKDEATPEPTTPALTPRANRLATKGDVLDLVKASGKQIVDARSLAEHCGDSVTAKRAGSVPGATHLDWSDLVEPKTRRFKEPDELTKLLRKSEIRLDRPSVTYCQSGGRASVMAFALELMGAKDVRNYYRSWSEWGNADDTPVVKPEPPKKK